MLEVLELKASMKLRLMQPLEEGRRVQRRGGLGSWTSFTASGDINNYPGGTEWKDYPCYFQIQIGT